MNWSKFVKCLALVAIALTCGVSQIYAQEQRDNKAVLEKMSKRITQAQREAAAKRLAEARAKVASQDKKIGSLSVDAPELVPTPGGTPDYFGSPNWAFSPSLRKFVDTLPGLGSAGVNNLGQYIPVAIPDTTTYPGSDYYEIELVEYTEKLHSDLPATKLRGYVQRNTTDPTVSTPHYLGPLIIAQKDRPVRVKFTNKLPTGSGGDLFIPVDTTIMGSGMGPLDMPGMPGMRENFTQNRAVLHLHGGLTPWISDGTPHQWITPVGENTSYPKGVSVSNVPDMPDPGDGSQTYYYTNQQSARLMFYHDHSWGITRLNVYAGEAAGYLLTDQTEQALITAGIIPADQIPLIIQDKSFVDADTVRNTDPTWNWGTGTPDPDTGARPPVTGDLWYPHVYSSAQNPYDISGVNAYGRWHYGPWFWPPTGDIPYGPVPNPYYDPINAPWQPPEMPGVPHPSMPGESFLDTAMVNGTAFPTLTVQPKAYRFRVLNAANDRFWNLQMYEADSTVTSTDGRTNTEVKMVPAAVTPGFPETWPADGREGGVPDPATAGPSWIQIGTEGGFLPAPVVIPNQPVTWNGDPTTFNFGNVSGHSLLLGPAERADVIVDFSQHAGKTLILYNDAPAAFPALDARYDYYTGAPDLTETGGHSGPQAGFGPNIRTIMQINVANTEPTAQFNLAALEAEFASTADKQGVFARSQDPLIVGQSAYNSAYNTTFPSTWPNWGVSRIQDRSLRFQTVAGTTLTIPMEPKAIQDEMGEAFDEYGRMSGKMGIELLNAGPQNQKFVLQNYVDPPTEVINDSMTPMSPVLGDGTQIWKITHNGVDTHPIHFHLFNVQLINRVGWDGAIRLPDANELGWKETVRVSPLEDTIVALRAVAPKQPFGIPDSIRPWNPAEPLGSTMGFTNINPFTGQPLSSPITNQLFNFGWEYIWHCHILSHEEMDMMRPIVFNVARQLPVEPVLDGTRVLAGVNLTWTDATPAGAFSTLGDPTNEIGFRIERAIGTNGVFEHIATALANATTYTDTSIQPLVYSYRVIAFNAAGDATSNIVTLALLSPPAAPSNLDATASVSANSPTVSLTWIDNSDNEAGFSIERATNVDFTQGLTTFEVGANVTAYTDTGVAPSTLYFYRVAASNSAGKSTYSNVASVTTADPLVAAPTNMRALRVSDNRAIITWNDNSNNEQGFFVERSTDGGATWTRIGQTSANSTLFRNNGLTAETTYLYRVQAYNTSGVSMFSNILTIATG